MNRYIKNLQGVKKLRKQKNNFIDFYLKTLPIRLLRVMMRFDKWHIYGSSIPEYVDTVVGIANELQCKKTVVEIGSGLGNIIKKCQYESKFAIDQEKATIRAAKLLNIKHRDIKFFTGSFNEVTMVNINLVILINWIHNIDSEELLAKLKNIKTDYFITEGVEDYQFYHSRNVFEKDFEVIKEIVCGKRHIFLLKPISGK